MFGRKKEKEKPLTYIEKRLRELDREICNIGDELRASAKSCYIKNMAMACYIPMTPDWEAQGERCREEQQKLLAKIGAYDDIRRQIIDLIKKDTSIRRVELLDSHELIEWELRRMFK